MFEKVVIDLHIGHLLERALPQEGEELASGPVHAHDVDGEALLEVVPELARLVT